MSVTLAGFVITLKRWWSHFFLHLTLSPSVNGCKRWLQWLITYWKACLQLIFLSWNCCSQKNIMRILNVQRIKWHFFFYNIKTEFDKEHLPRAFTKHSGRQMSCISLALEISSKMTENVVAMPFIWEPTKGMLQK